jgi:hypothetical protein
MIIVGALVINHHGHTPTPLQIVLLESMSIPVTNYCCRCCSSGT